MASESSLKTTKSTDTPAEANGVPVLHEEDPWTTEELAEVRAGLVVDDERLHTELAEAQHDLSLLIYESGEGSGDDQADAGAATWEREHEMTLANNARALMEHRVVGVLTFVDQPLMRLLTRGHQLVMLLLTRLHQLVLLLLT